MEIDLEKIKSFLDCDDAFVAQLFESFIAESSECIGIIENSFDNKEWKKIRGATHKMLGSARIFDLDILSQLLEQIETDAENETNLESMKEKIEQLSVLHKDCIDSMSEFIRVNA